MCNKSNDLIIIRLVFPCQTCSVYAMKQFGHKLCNFQANYEDFLFFALSMDFGPLANLLLTSRLKIQPNPN